VDVYYSDDDDIMYGVEALATLVTKVEDFRAHMLFAINTDDEPADSESMLHFMLALDALSQARYQLKLAQKKTTKS
jgi:hypothetical protein